MSDVSINVTEWKATINLSKNIYFSYFKCNCSRFDLNSFSHYFRFNRRLIQYILYKDFNCERRNKCIDYTPSTPLWYSPQTNEFNGENMNKLFTTADATKRNLSDLKSRHVSSLKEKTLQQYIRNFKEIYGCSSQMITMRYLTLFILTCYCAIDGNIQLEWIWLYWPAWRRYSSHFYIQLHHILDCYIPV